MMSSLRRRSIVQPAWKQHVRKKGGLARKLKLAYNLHFDLDPALFS